MFSFSYYWAKTRLDELRLAIIVPNVLVIILFPQPSCYADSAVVTFNTLWCYVVWPYSLWRIVAIVMPCHYVVALHCVTSSLCRSRWLEKCRGTSSRGTMSLVRGWYSHRHVDKGSPAVRIRCQTSSHPPYQNWRRHRVVWMRQAENSVSPPMVPKIKYPSITMHFRMSTLVLPCNGTCPVWHLSIIIDTTWLCYSFFYDTDSTYSTIYVYGRCICACIQ